MSRGHGVRQRRAVELLSADARARREGLTFAALRPVLGPDRSDRRRVVRSLIRRGDLEAVTDPETGERRLRLTFLTCASVMMKLEPLDAEPEPDPREHFREMEAALAVVRERKEERRRALAAREALWEEPGRPSRRRSLGPNQLRALAVLIRYAPDPQMGLPAAAVRRIACTGVGGKKANVLRGVRSLIARGVLQRSRDGERLRLTNWRTPLLHQHVPHMVDPPLDDAKAEAVLDAFGVPVGCRVGR